jgi:perosamine synthetase
MVARFEAGLRQQLELSRPVAVNSGTAALHLALSVAGVKAGDEVVVPAQTFVATGMAVLAQGATPVFADIDPGTGNLAAESFADEVSPRTRAVIPVHWAGLPCDLDEINAIARRHQVAVIEDAAHALGASYKGQAIGSISRFTAFSFQAIKHLTAGDGGALCCVDQADEDVTRARRWFGIDRQRSTPSILGEREFDIDAPGFKYHMNDLAAAVGLGNLDGFADRLGRRRNIDGRYREELADTPGLRLLRLPEDRESACWLFTLLVDRREDFIRALASEGIPASVVHLRIDRYSVFGGCREHLPGQAQFDAQQISLPVHDDLTDEEVGRTISRIRRGW